MHIEHASNKLSLFWAHLLHCSKFWISCTVGRR